MKKEIALLCLPALLLGLFAGCGKTETAVETTAETTVATQPATEPTAPAELTEEEKQIILQSRRDTAEAHMRYMMSFLWQTDVSIDYSYDVSSLGIAMDDENQILHLEAGRVYSGMPYTHGSGGAESFLSYGEPDENGVMQMSGLTTDLLSGGGGTKNYNMARLSNDCADAVGWAWSRVGNSFTFTVTQNMTAERGCLPVGNYKTVDGNYKKTRDIVKENGEKVMFEAYACLQKADAVVCYNGSGHAMMIAQVNVVRDGGGAIDPEQSYVLVHEQFTGNAHKEVTRVDETTGLTVYCLGGVDRKYTFTQLFKKSYVPVTIQELIDPAPVAPAELLDSLEEHTFLNLTKGTLSCSYKICTVTITITDDNGAVVQQATCFPMESERYLFWMKHFTEAQEQPVMQGSFAPEELAPGSYHATVQCIVGTGETLTARDFTFTVSD